MGASDSKNVPPGISDNSPFSKIELKKVIKSFNKHVGEDGTVTIKSFKKILNELMGKGLGLNYNPDDPFAEDLYELCDADKDGKVTKEELITGIGLVCKGTPVEKAKLMFDMWDENKDGKLDEKELEKMFIRCYKSAFRVLMKAKSNDVGTTKANTADGYAMQLGPVVSKQMFAYIDKDKSGTIEKDEFLALLGQENAKLTIRATLNGEEYKSFMGFF